MNFKCFQQLCRQFVLDGFSNVVLSFSVEEISIRLSRNVEQIITMISAIFKHVNLDQQALELQFEV